MIWDNLTGPSHLVLLVDPSAWFISTGCMKRMVIEPELINGGN